MSDNAQLMSALDQGRQVGSGAKAGGSTPMSIPDVPVVGGGTTTNPLAALFASQGGGQGGQQGGSILPNFPMVELAPGPQRMPQGPDAAGPKPPQTNELGGAAQAIGTIAAVAGLIAALL